MSKTLIQENWTIFQNIRKYALFPHNCKICNGLGGGLWYKLVLCCKSKFTIKARNYHYIKTWISFSLVTTALLCLRETRSIKQQSDEQREDTLSEIDIKSVLEVAKIR